MKALVVIPTYNEKENILRMIDALFALKEDLGVLVVDDNSPDGTGDMLDTLAAKDSRVHVLHRSGKLGLGSAYREGFKKAIEMDVTFIIQMDADFSHDPATIHQFLNIIKETDVVVGSRYLEGANVVNWPISRLLLSWFANKYTRVVTGLPVNDATGGFKCFRREVLADLDFDSMTSDGYSFQIEMNFNCWRKGYRFTELPIVFTDRFHGTSKMSKKIIWEAVWMVWKLRLMSLLGRI